VAKDVDMNEELVKYLQDVHGMEQQSLQTLEAAVKIAGDPQLEALYRGHLKETREHLRLIEERLDAHEGSRSLKQDLAGRLKAVGLGAGVVANPDTPAKLVAVAYGFEHFEIASYELLRRVAQRAGDEDTVKTVDTILVNEQQAAEKLAASYDLALERSLHGSVKA
jgi:ferritin-like metal-binding protein YciE